MNVDKMFEELGYAKVEPPYLGVDVVALYTKATIKIWFFRDKTFMKSDFGATCIDMLELKAINEKVKELWVV